MSDLSPNPRSQVRTPISGRFSKRVLKKGKQTTAKGGPGGKEINKNLGIAGHINQQAWHGPVWGPTSTIELELNLAKFKTEVRKITVQTVVGELFFYDFQVGLFSKQVVLGIKNINSHAYKYLLFWVLVWVEFRKSIHILYDINIFMTWFIYFLRVPN